jgi:hypothetical protein
MAMALFSTLFIKCVQLSTVNITTVQLQPVEEELLYKIVDGLQRRNLFGTRLCLSSRS